MGEPYLYPEGDSDCCGAPCYGDSGDYICSECHEHCGLAEEEEEDAEVP